MTCCFSLLVALKSKFTLTDTTVVTRHAFLEEAVPVDEAVARILFWDFIEQFQALLRKLDARGSKAYQLGSQSLLMVRRFEVNVYNALNMVNAFDIEI